MKAYRFLLMDLDDTLLDFKQAEAHALSDLLHQWQVACDEEVISTYHMYNDRCWKALERGEITKERLQTKRFEDFLAHYHLPLDPVDAGQRYAKALSRYGIVFPGALSLVRQLAKRYELYAITNGIAMVQAGRIVSSGLAPYFKQVFVSEEAGAAKPEKAYFDYVAQKIPGFVKEEALIIGDSLSSDIQGGIHAGIDTFWYNPGKATASLKPTYEAASLEEVQRLLTLN